MQALTPHFSLEFLSFVFEEKADGGGEMGPSETEVISYLSCQCSWPFLIHFLWLHPCQLCAGPSTSPWEPWPLLFGTDILSLFLLASTQSRAQGDGWGARADPGPGEEWVSGLLLCLKWDNPLVCQRQTQVPLTWKEVVNEVTQAVNLWFICWEHSCKACISTISRLAVKLLDCLLSSLNFLKLGKFLGPLRTHCVCVWERETERH